MRLPFLKLILVWKAGIFIPRGDKLRVRIRNRIKARLKIRVRFIVRVDIR